MICIVKVMIGNQMDDMLRCEILAYDSSDKDIVNYLTEMIEQYISLCEWSREYIYSTDIIKPIVMASTQEIDYDVSKIFR